MQYRSVFLSAPELPAFALKLQYYETPSWMPIHFPSLSRFCAPDVCATLVAVCEFHFVRHGSLTSISNHSPPASAGSLAAFYMRILQPFRCIYRFSCVLADILPFPKHLCPCMDILHNSPASPTPISL